MCVTVLLRGGEERRDDGVKQSLLIQTWETQGRQEHSRSTYTNNTGRRKQGTDNTLNTKLNEGKRQDTPEPNERNQTREKLGHREHMGRKTYTEQEASMALPPPPWRCVLAPLNSSERGWVGAYKIRLTLDELPPGQYRFQELWQFRVPLRRRQFRGQWRNGQFRGNGGTCSSGCHGRTTSVVLASTQTLQPEAWLAQELGWAQDSTPVCTWEPQCSLRCIWEQKPTLGYTHEQDHSRS